MELNDFRRRRPSLFGYFIASLAGAVLGVFLILTFGPATLFTKFQQPVEPENVPTTQPVVQVPQISDISIAANKAMDSVVGVRTVEKIDKSLFQNKKVQGVGSGIIIDSSGYIVTNNQIAGMDSKDIKVTLNDGREVTGKAVWADPVLDLSIIKITADNLTAAVLGDSRGVKIGEVAIAVGNPLGNIFHRTVAEGIISAVDMTKEVEKDVFMAGLLQTDALINQYNSGGPLVNVSGEVIGINTLKISAGERMGFAIPVNIIKPALKAIKDTGKFETPSLGIKAFDKGMAKYYGDKDIARGILVTGVEKGKAAEKAGIRAGDIILTINGEEVNSMNSFREALYTAGSGSTVKVKISRPLGESTVNVELKQNNIVKGEALTP